jgi:predicted amidophosphoribosyltransferase
MTIDPQSDFGTRECPNCAVDVSANENRCPICGYEFPGRGLLHRNLIWIVLLFLALLLIPLLLSLR